MFLSYNHLIYFIQYRKNFEIYQKFDFTIFSNFLFFSTALKNIRVVAKNFTETPNNRQYIHSVSLSILPRSPAILYHSLYPTSSSYLSPANLFHN